MTHKPPQGIDAQPLGPCICPPGHIGHWEACPAGYIKPASLSDTQGIDAGLREALRQLRMTAKDARYDWSEIMGIRLSRLADEIEAAAPPDPRKDLALEDLVANWRSRADLNTKAAKGVIAMATTKAALREAAKTLIECAARLEQRLAEMRGAKR